MAWSSEWSRRRADAYCEVFEPSAIRREEFAYLVSALEGFFGDRHRGLSLEFVTTRRQSALILLGKVESVICFDVMQSCTADYA